MQCVCDVCMPDAKLLFECVVEAYMALLEQGTSLPCVAPMAWWMVHVANTIYIVDV